MLVINTEKFEVLGFFNGYWGVIRRGDDEAVFSSKVKVIDQKVVVFLKPDGTVEPSYATSSRSRKDIKLQQRVIALIDQLSNLQT